MFRKRTRRPTRRQEMQDDEEDTNVASKLESTKKRQQSHQKAPKQRIKPVKEEEDADEEQVEDVWEKKRQKALEDFVNERTGVKSKESEHRNAPQHQTDDFNPIGAALLEVVLPGSKPNMAPVKRTAPPPARQEAPQQQFDNIDDDDERIGFQAHRHRNRMSDTKRGPQATDTHVYRQFVKRIRKR